MFKVVCTLKYLIETFCITLLSISVMRVASSFLPPVLLKNRVCALLSLLKKANLSEPAFFRSNCSSKLASLYCDFMFCTL